MKKGSGKGLFFNSDQLFITNGDKYRSIKMIIQGGQTKGIGIITAEIDALNIIFMDRQGLVHFSDKYRQNRIQLILYAYISFIIARLRGTFGFTSQEDKNSA